MRNVIDRIIARGKNPSIWAVLAATFGIFPDAWATYSAVVVSALGAVAVFMRERG